MIILKMLFTKVLYASVTASFLIMLVLLAKKLLNFRLSPRLHHGLWLLVLIRLLVPVVPESPLSIFNVVTQAGHAAVGYVNSVIEDNTSNNTNKSDFSSRNQKQTQTNNVVDTANGNNVANDAKQEKPFTKEINSKKLTIPSTTEKNTLNQIMIKVLSCLWFIIFISLIICNLIFTYKFKKRVQNLSLVTDTQITSILNECKSKLKIKKDILIYDTDSACSPFVGGMLLPKIYFPKDVLNEIEEKQLTHVMMHELVHYKRKDLFYNFFAVVSTALHWFNPLVLVAMKKMKEDREIACDAYVLETLGENESTEYGMTLIKLSRLSKLNHTRLSPVTFYESKSQLERRILMINKFKNGTNKLSALTLAVCLIVGSITLTNATAANGKADFNKTSKNSSAFKVYWGNGVNIADLKRASSFTNVNFKVPDFLPEDMKFTDASIEKKILDNQDVIDIRFAGSSPGFSMEISKGNLLKDLSSNEIGSSYKKYKKTVNQRPMTISNINGTCVTIHRELMNKADAVSHVAHMTDPNTGKDIINTITTTAPLEYNDKYFLWQDKGISYWINYYSDSVSLSKKVHKNIISDDDLQQIIKSFKYLKDIKNVSYHTVLPNNYINIYDESDLISAKKMLGFKLIIPSSLPEGLVLTSGTANEYSSSGNGNDCKKITTTYDTKPFNSKNKRSEVEFSQSNSNVSIITLDKNYAKTLNINGAEVLTGKRGGNIFYTWKKNNIYYFLAISISSKFNQSKILSAVVK
jgi:bla regulator protein BlaR1